MLCLQGVIHGIPTVLIPPGWDSTPGLKSTAKPTAVPTEQQQQQTSTEGGKRAADRASSGAGRRLLGNGIDQFTKTVVPMNAVETQIRSQTRSMFREAEDRWG